MQSLLLQHGRALCSDGVRAATAAKFAVPLDLHIVAARLDEGPRADHTANSSVCKRGMLGHLKLRGAGVLSLTFVLTAGVYGTGQEGLQRMVADIKHVCALWRVGCSRPKPCGFARSQGEKRSTQVHAEARRLCLCPVPG